jgi:hypothetical protein
MSKKLFALLVGIGNYPEPIRKLYGPLRDVEKIKNYLEKYEKEYFDIHLHAPLLNKDATKENITAAFMTHLGKAKEGDVALFYFSGHGTHEDADQSLWTNETDGKLECLICYDSVEKGSDYYNLLADKELRWMISKIASTGAHVITLFDCCHSGDVTRDAWIMDNVNTLIPKKAGRPIGTVKGGAFPKRALVDFIFWREIKDSYQQGTSLEPIIPEGRHIQISACRNDESAWESNAEGIFTKYLIEVLIRSKGLVTYYDLKSRVQHYIKNQFTQTPQIYASKEPNDLFLGFLGKHQRNKPLYGNIVYNLPRHQRTGNWTMDVGALHGISKRIKEIKVESEDGSIKIVAQPKTISPGETILEISEESREILNTEESYRGYVDGFHSAPISVYIANIDQNIDAEEQLVKGIQNILNIFLTLDEKAADYTLLIGKGLYQVVLPGDYQKNYDRPLIKQEEASETGLRYFLSHLTHISQWAYVRHLHNPNSFKFNEFPIEVECWKVEEQDEQSFIDKLLEIKGDLIEIPFEKVPYWNAKKEKKYRIGQNLKIRLTNKCKHKLHLACLMLGSDFDSNPNALKPNVQSLDPGKDIYLCGHRYLINITPFRRMDFIHEFEWEYDTTFLKVIASTNQEALQSAIVHLSMDSLPHPSRGVMKDIPKGGFDDEENERVDDWIIRTIEIRFLS